MLLKNFNQQYSINCTSSGDPSYVEANLHCLVKVTSLRNNQKHFQIIIKCFVFQETISKSSPETFTEEIQEVPLTLHNLHQILIKYDPKSGE